MTLPERLTLRGLDLNLAADTLGSRDAPAILFLHGGGQTRQSWGAALEAAAKRGYCALSLDLRGHGESDWAPDGRYELSRFVGDVKHAIEQIDAEPVLVGASLGGFISLMIAGSPPPRTRGLVLVDVTPRIEQQGAQEIGVFMRSAPNGFGSLEEAADAVAAYLPHRKRPKNTNGLLRNLRLREGRYYWHWDPAFLRLSSDADMQRAMLDTTGPLEAAARALAVPTLLVRGGRSRVVSETGVREFLQLVPHAEYVDIADADHMVAGDANDPFNDAVLDFIDRHRSD
jgi:pimeloyl-ACP methyl ester carboxylesterase